MAKGRELKGRIKSVENTRKITRTMEMVATSKMKRAQDRVVAARPYANSLTEVIANLYTPELAERFPLMRQPASIRKAAIIPLPATVDGGSFQRESVEGSPQSPGEADGSRSGAGAPTSSAKGARLLSLHWTAVASSRTDITGQPTVQECGGARRWPHREIRVRGHRRRVRDLLGNSIPRCPLRRRRSWCCR
jgi:F-type H+-transporting ATPase subunit gamma